MKSYTHAVISSTLAWTGNVFYEMWKGKDFVPDLGTDPIAAEEVRKLSPELTLYNALNLSWTYFVYPLKRLCLQIIRKNI
jgi:hypothetical protein